MKKVLVAMAAVALMASPAMAAAPSSLGTIYTNQNGGGYNTAQYHSYDGLICTDCHTLHGSENGQAVTAGAAAGELWGGTSDGSGPYRELLKKGDWSDMCLSCHKEGYNTAATADLPGVEVINGGWTAPIVMTLTGVEPAGYNLPAGDFYFSAGDGADSSYKKGHNPAYSAGSDVTELSTTAAATSKMINVDPVLKGVPPGGSITDGEWSCHSCHGMHSRFSSTYSAYRQIKRKVNKIITTGCDQTAALGVIESASVCDTVSVNTTASGYEAIKSNSRGNVNGFNYVNTKASGAPLDGANLVSATNYGVDNKNVYRGGFSSFCAACHGLFHGGAVEDEDTATTNTNTNTMVAEAWVRHPTNISMGQTQSSRKYGVNTYTKAVSASQAAGSPNPAGYDWKYPLVVSDYSTVLVNGGAADLTTAGKVTVDDRIMCLTCHKAHASQYENMTRWDANKHSFLPGGSTDFEGGTDTRDNVAYGCGKCHQKGGTKAYVKQF